MIASELWVWGSMAMCGSTSVCTGIAVGHVCGVRDQPESFSIQLSNDRGPHLAGA